MKLNRFTFIASGIALALSISPSEIRLSEIKNNLINNKTEQTNTTEIESHTVKKLVTNTNEKLNTNKYDTLKIQKSNAGSAVGRYIGREAGRGNPIAQIIGVVILGFVVISLIVVIAANFFN